MMKAGGEGRQTVFLFADNQIKDESFMEDISMILNTGDVPNLYAQDEKAEIIEKMQTVARNEVSYTFLPLPCWKSISVETSAEASLPAAMQPC